MHPLTTTKPALRLLALLLALYISSCSVTERGLSESLPPAADPAASGSPLLHGLPALAELDSLRSASEPVTLSKDGSEFHTKSEGAVTAGTELQITSAAGEIEWAIYGFDPAGAVPQGLQADITLTNGTSYFMLADYSEDRWEVVSSAAAVDVTLEEAFELSPGGLVFCAVLCWDTQAAGVQSVHLICEEAPVSPGAIIDGEGNTGSESCLVLVDGMPAIAYYDFEQSRLRYVRASDAAGSAWGSAITVDDEGSQGRFPSMTIVNGRPAIAYFDAGNEYLRYVRASDQFGTAWGEPLDVDSSDICGEFASLCIVNGNPAISYQAYGAETLRYVRASDQDGTAWGEPLDVDSIGSSDSSQEGTSLLVADGNPAIAYYSYSEDALMYVRAADNTGANWAEPLLLDDTPGAGRYASMIHLNGNPAICYAGDDAGSLSFIRSENAAGTSWIGGETIDSAANDAAMISFSVIDGRPAAVFYDFSDGELCFLHSSDASGSVWPATRILDDAGNTGAHPSLLQLPGGIAGVSYQDIDLGNLMFQLGFEE